jgi:hypothetical protein
MIINILLQIATMMEILEFGLALANGTDPAMNKEFLAGTHDAMMGKRRLIPIYIYAPQYPSIFPPPRTLLGRNF